MLCGEGTRVKRDAETIRAVTLRCRSWTCPECAPRRRRELIALAASGRPETFITLTCNPAMPGEPYEKARALASAWRTIVRRAKKRWRYNKLEYIAVFEATKAGWPHLHILARVKWIDQRWLSDQMKALTNAPIVDIRRADQPGRAATYIAKYIGKDAHHFGTCKRYWSTMGWEIGKPLRPWVHQIWSREPAELSRLSVAEWIEFAERRGLYIEHASDRAEIYFHGPPARDEVPFP